MQFLKDKITNLIKTSIEGTFPAVAAQVKIEYPDESAHGDYSSPIALELARKVGMPPRKIAEKIVENIEKVEWIEKIEIAGPGFINFFMSPNFLVEFSGEIAEAGKTYGNSDEYKGKTVVTDTSHPNIAKPMGVHHLLSTIIGNALNRIFAGAGYTLIRDNYLGDWGTQYGKLMFAYKKWGNEEAVKKNPIPELLKLYVRFHEEVEKDPELENEGRAEFKKLEDGDAENRKLWQWIVDLSKKEFYKTWKRLSVEFDVINGESFYEDKMRAIIEMGISKGVFVEGERGALIAPFEHEKYPPCIIRKADGATIYATRDLARIKYWEDTWHPDLMVNVVDTAQEMYFKQLFEVAEKLKLTDAKNVHVWFGRMSFPEGRMSTRKGTVVLMENVLDEAEKRAYDIIKEKNPDLPEAKKRVIAAQVGIGAVKYVVLSQNRTTNMIFTWDKILSLEGNSAPYIQYVHARAKAVLRKVVEKQVAVGVGAHEIPITPQEHELLRLLPRLPEVIVQSAEEFKPNLIANYLYAVASAFNSFYGAVPVLKGEEAALNRRLNLIEATATVLSNGLEFLGIAAPDEM